ncbi:SusD/RagB family nutrient-binding outer membrane lipoprotein [Pedobacter sp. L105]|uniref:SusD/RagB family nutrient-binding outer membrane lipoprotein n=1 Tax=Pedobacter sp. L105 TaxID=1641871 RepID=UPI00131ABE06|nr:SusD/RagB family nutrient-binding outer membrane lipoprotein [Pedobacter sp. L105]
MITKKIFNPKKLLLMLFVGTAALSGCKKFLDVNQNPNNPDSAQSSLLLPTVEAAVGQITGNYFQIYGGMLSQYWTQSTSAGQYKAIDQYIQHNTDFDGAWSVLYHNALINSQLIITSKESNVQVTQGMAYILKAYAAQLTTDAFGDIPLAEALNAGQFNNPHYEAQASVYDSIFTYIDKGMVLLNNTSSANPGSQDIIFQGDVVKWKQFGNTLKLRAYLRIIKADPNKAAAGIAALYATNPAFLTADASIIYNSVGGNENPLYNTMVALGKTQNLVASSTAVSAFERNSDPRLYKFYDPIPGQDTITAIPQGSYLSFPGKIVSIPSALVGASPLLPASATAPVKLISTSESDFLQAEAVVRGLATKGDASTLFQAGITASFIATGLQATDAAAYIAAAPDALPAFNAAGSTEDKIKAIITQKYYSMNGFQGFEAWTEWRRTGYPTFFILSEASKQGNGFPVRFLYPNSEAVSNLNYPGTVSDITPVWWDK